MIGTIIGSYKVTEKIGEGGMGAVFKGIDTMLEREVAIKMLRPELASQPDIVERFRTEAVTLAKLNHPNIATLYSFLRQGEDFFMVMEFVRGHTLDEVIRKFGAMDCNRAIVLFCQSLEGIEHAHRMGIVHRDIKPANIMLTDSGSIKVMDFGIARVLGTARMTRQGNIVGTVEYMAPEQVRGNASDARSDIYSLGILLYEMLTGRVPFEHDSEFELMRAQVEDAPKPPRTFTSTIPLAVEQAIMRALAKKPEARPQTALELRTALLATLSPSATMNITTPPYAAPTTRMLESPTQTTGEKAAKSNPLSREAEIATQILGEPFAKTHATGDQIRETQAVQPGASTAAGMASQQPTGAVNASTPLVARLNWKHYAAAAVVVIALIATVPFALRASRGAEQPQEPPAAEETAAPTEAPAADPQANPAAAPSDTSAAPGIEPGADSARVDRSASASNANVEKAARSRGNRNAPPAEAENTASPSATAPTETSPAPPPAQAAPPPSQPTDAAAQGAEASKKEAPVTATQNLNKNEKKKGGLGGFLKKVFKGNDKKNDNKN